MGAKKSPRNRQPGALRKSRSKKERNVVYRNRPKFSSRLRDFEKDFRESLTCFEAITHQFFSTAKSIALQLALFLLLTYSLILAVHRFVWTETPSELKAPVEGRDSFIPSPRLQDFWSPHTPDFR